MQQWSLLCFQMQFNVYICIDSFYRRLCLRNTSEIFRRSDLEEKKPQNAKKLPCLALVENDGCFLSLKRIEYYTKLISSERNRNRFYLKSVRPTSSVNLMPYLLEKNILLSFYLACDVELPCRFNFYVPPKPQLPMKFVSLSCASDS